MKLVGQVTDPCAYDIVQRPSTSASTEDKLPWSVAQSENLTQVKLEEQFRGVFQGKVSIEEQQYANGNVLLGSS